MVHIDDGELATVRSDGFHHLHPGVALTSKQPVTVDWAEEDTTAARHEHFMIKEIHEQPEAVRRCIQGRLDERFWSAHLGGLSLQAHQARAIRRVKILGCGSAYYAGQLGAQFIEEVARVPADAEPASEFRYRNPVVDPDTLYVAVSQSGETYDTLAAVQEVKRKGGHVVGLVNVVGSSIARECLGGIYLHAGPELAVASTKALTNMSVAFALLGLHLGRIRDVSARDGRRLLQGIARLPSQIGGDRGGRGGHRRGRALAGHGAEHLLRRSGARLPRGQGGRAEAEGGAPTCTPRPTRPRSSSTDRSRSCPRSSRRWRSSPTTSCSTGTSPPCTR